MNLRRILPVIPLFALAACEEATAGGIIAGGIGLYVIGSLLALAVVIFAILDLIKKPYPTEKKLIWGAIIFFIPFIGALLYFFIGRNKQEVF